MPRGTADSYVGAFVGCDADDSDHFRLRLAVHEVKGHLDSTHTLELSRGELVEIQSQIALALAHGISTPVTYCLCGKPEDDGLCGCEGQP